MADFPVKEKEINILANTMIEGYKRHLADFPNVIWPLLNVKRLMYNGAKTAQSQALTDFRLTTKAKNQSLDNLISVMRNCLIKSEVDVAGDLVKLAYIGWGPKTLPQPIESPGQPVNLTIINQADCSLTLKWQRPTSGGPVRYYLIERRQKEQSGSFGPWQLVSSSYNKKKKLTKQPKGIELEYRIIAVNSSGKGAESNVVTAVL